MHLPWSRRRQFEADAAHAQVRHGDDALEATEAREHVACARVDAHALLCKNYLLALRADDALEEAILYTPEQLASACQPTRSAARATWLRASAAAPPRDLADGRLAQRLLLSREACGARDGGGTVAVAGVVAFVDKLLRHNVRRPRARGW